MKKYKIKKRDIKKYSLMFTTIVLLSVIFFFTGAEADMAKEETTIHEYVTKEGGTEAPFDNAYWDEKRPGIYVDYNTGEPLFSSLDKYDSGTGWPAFTKPINDSKIKREIDTSNGMIRTEVKTEESHLGHVFPDGPDGGDRFCINSASMKFIPYEELEEQGYGEYKELFPFDEIVLAGGCFWGVEHLLETQEGVVSATSGYTGGRTINPTYKTVLTGITGHAEAVRVVYNTTIISTEEVLDIFWRLHDPTQLNRQGPDIGTQYRSAIFYNSVEQKNIAEKSKAAFDAKGVFDMPAVTTLEPLGKFYPAEEYHQDYVVKNPNYVCHTLRDE